MLTLIADLIIGHGLGQIIRGWDFCNGIINWCYCSERMVGFQRFWLYQMWICWFQITAITVVKVTQWCWLTLTGERRFHRRVGLHPIKVYCHHYCWCCERDPMVDIDRGEEIWLRVGLHQGSKSQTGCDLPPHITVIRITWLDPHWWLLNFSEWWWFLRWKSSSLWHVMVNIVKTCFGCSLNFPIALSLSRWLCTQVIWLLCTWDDTPSAKIMHFLCSQLHHAHRLLSLEIGWGGLSSQIPVSVSHLSHSLSSQLTWVGSQTFPSLITIFIQLDGVPGVK